MLPFATRYADAAPIYTVTTGSDVGDGLCDATCTLREAINAANRTQGTEIHFDLPGTATSIDLASALPPTISPVTIDATTQLGYKSTPIVVLNGSGAGADASGLVVGGGNTRIRGLSIVRFGRYGIDLQSNSNFVGDNWVGLDPSGAAAGNGRSTLRSGAIYGGIRVASGANNNVGNSDQRNIVSANSGQGIEVSAAATSTRIVNNIVGTNLRSSRGFGNTFNGIYIGANGTTIGNNASWYNGTGLSFSADSLTVSSNSFNANTNVGVLGAGSGSTFTSNSLIANANGGFFLGFPGATTSNNTFYDNTVRNNGGAGFTFRGPTGQPTEITDANTITRGSITNNAGKGIDLAFGANGGVQPPAITDVVSSLDIPLEVSGTAALNATIQLYADPTDEGQTFLASITSKASDGTWSINTGWAPGVDPAAIGAAVKTGALVLRATQATAEGTSEFSGALTITGIRGIATCNGGITLLTGALVQLYSGSALVGSTFSDFDTAAYLFRGVAPNATYVVRITLAPIEGPGVTISCSATTTTDASGSSTVGGGVVVPNRGNHVWPKALDLADPTKRATLLGDRNWRIDDFVFQQGQSTWFKVPVRPGQRVLATVTNVPADYSVALYKDIRALFDAQVASLTGTPEEKLAAIRRLDASVAPDALSPDALSPDELSPDALSPDALSPDALSPDALSPDALSPDELSPDELSPDALSPDALSPDALSPDALSSAELSDAYAGAQTSALIGVSAHVGLSPEQIGRNTWDNRGYFYVRVRGHNGVFDASRPFTIEIKVTDVACTGVTLNDTPLTYTPATTGRKTVILTNSAQFPAGTNTTALRAKLDAFAASGADIAGAVVDLKDIPGVASAYAIWNAAQDCPAAANILARRIRDVINAYRGSANPDFAYVVLAGNDHVIPFFRIPDQSGLGSEKDYRPAVQDPTASQASLRFGYVLTQDFYGSAAPISRFDHELYVPDLAVGRLVETVADMSAVIDAYYSAHGIVAPTSALVTGYDFLADAALDIAGQLQTNVTTMDAQLIQPVGEPPSGPNAWTAPQLRSKLFGPTTYGILSLNSHFSGNSMLASDYATRVLSSEISTLAATDTRFRNALILSTGCHSGYNIVDGEATALTQPIDWAQAFASRGATVVGGSGYQYGDTDFIKYSEKIMTDVVRELRYGSGPIAIGVALMNAKRTYLASLVSLKGIDEKAMAEATLYGLPMLGYNLPGTRPARPSSGAAPTLTALTSPGLSSADLSLTPALNLNTKTLTQLGGTGTTTATYFDAGGNVSVNPGAPVLPLTVDNVNVAGQALRGAVLMTADYTDLPLTPFTDVATTEVRGAHAPYITSVFTPVRPFDLNQFAGSNLVTTPFQYRSLDGLTNGIGRKITSESFRLYYSTLTDARALAASPVVYTVTLKPGLDPANVDVSVTIGALGPLTGASALGVQDIWVTYTGETGSLKGHWASLALDRVGTATNGTSVVLYYGGSIPRGTTLTNDVRALIQAVGGNGLVTWASNDGAYYAVVNESATAADPKISTSLALSAASTTGTYRSTLPVRARLTTPAGGLNGKRVSFRSGGVRVDAMTDTDLATGQAGWVSAQIPLVAAPGSAALTVGFTEDEDYLGSGAEVAITVTRAPSTFAPASPIVLAGGSILLGTLMGADEPLGGQLVMLSGSGKTVQTFTDGYGRVRMDTLDGLPSGGFTVTVGYAGNDRYLPTTSAGVTVPATFVTAGGWILTPPGAIGLPAIGKKSNFSLNARYKSGDTVPSGSFEFKATESNVTFKATSFESMSVTGATAEVLGRGTVNGSAGWSFRVNVAEGSPDTLTVTIWKTSGGLFDSPSYKASNALSGGNVVVH